MKIVRMLWMAVLCGTCLGGVIASHAEQEQPAAISPDGGRYYGPLVNGLREGKGRVEWDNGARYEGEFAKGVYAGSGRMRTATGSVMTGQFKNGLADGKGEVKYSNGRSYRGEFARGALHGKGRFEYTNGAVYEGDFVNDEFTGTGSVTWPQGSRHVGRFKNWNIAGPGKTIDQYGNSYEGQFTSKGPTGKVTFRSVDGSVYVGEMQDWRPHGRGEMRLANGDVYRGGFEHGLYSGQGTLTYGKPQSDGRREDKGIWRYGRLKAVEEEKERRAQLNAEQVLYNQPALLAKQFDTLLPASKDRINLYLLAIGGDGSQEVFRREVEFVTRQFKTRFGTEGRTLALVNSRTTVDALPLATRTSIRQAIAAIGAAMNKERDILFLFVTSHGSRNKELVMGLTGMDLPPLRAAELATMLKEAGIRWKVMVVSACYSGGFIKDLQDPHTMIITASRADRTSFGCADDRDMTRFGLAFFKDALPHARSFEDAFADAVRRVEEEERRDADVAPARNDVLPAAVVDRWQAMAHFIGIFQRVLASDTSQTKQGAAEKKKGKPVHRSLPQMDAPEPIRQHLALWWQGLPSPSSQTAAATKTTATSMTTKTVK